MQPSLISIVVPCYNQGHFLAQSLASVQNQSYGNWECIIVNDGSIDETERIVKSFAEKDQRFIYLFQPNGGLSNARNTGISHAKGNFLQFLDADDLLTPNKIETALNLYHQNRDDYSSTILYSSMRYFEDGLPNNLKILGRDNFIAHVELKSDDSLDNQKEVLFARNAFVISAPLYPTNLFKTIGNFDENLKALEDWDFHIRCIKAGFKFHHFYEKEAMTHIRLHNNSMMRDQRLMDENFAKFLYKHNLREVQILKKKAFKAYIKDFIPPIILTLKQHFFNRK